MPPKNDAADKPLPSDKPNGLDAAALARQVEDLQGQLAQVLGRLDAQNGKAAEPVEVKKTKKAGEYVATTRGHIPGLGVIEPGQAIPADIPIGSWMTKASGKKAEADDDSDVDEDGLDKD